MIHYNSSNNLLVLANGWGDIATFIVIALFYLAGAIAKALANRAKSQDQPSGRSSALSSPKKDRGRQISEWDRRLAQKKSQKAAVIPQVRFSAQSIAQQKSQTYKPPARESFIGRIVSPIGGQMVGGSGNQYFIKPPASIPTKTSSAVTQEEKKITAILSDKNKIVKPFTVGLWQSMRSPENLRNSVILKEILDKPLAFRDAF
ncbi:MAG TPA: hypothetical protein PK525_01250 [Anaerohalosphaeraceae bacterium]|nr:hypothetical protein [Anaerohalosphaeraceae bacterium]